LFNLQEGGTTIVEHVGEPQVSLSNHGTEVSLLYEELRPSLGAYLFTLGLIDPEAEDLIQEGFFRLVRVLAAEIRVNNPRGWLFRVVHNLAMDVYRDADRDGVVIDESQLWIQQQQVDPDPNPEQAYSLRERLKLVNAAALSLTSQQRDCLLLRAEGRSYQDIGLTLGISTQRVAIVVRKGLERLAVLCRVTEYRTCG